MTDLNGDEAKTIRRKINFRLKTLKMQVEPNQCPSHQFILIIQGPIPEILVKRYWELVDFWVGHFGIFFCFIPIRISHKLLGSMDGTQSLWYEVCKSPYDYIPMQCNAYFRLTTIDVARIFSRFVFDSLLGYRSREARSINFNILGFVPFCQMHKIFSTKKELMF